MRKPSAPLTQSRLSTHAQQGFETAPEKMGPPQPERCGCRSQKKFPFALRTEPARRRFVGPRNIISAGFNKSRHLEPMFIGSSTGKRCGRRLSGRNWTVYPHPADASIRRQRRPATRRERVGVLSISRPSPPRSPRVGALLLGSVSRGVAPSTGGCFLVAACFWRRIEGHAPATESRHVR